MSSPEQEQTRADMMAAWDDDLAALRAAQATVDALGAELQSMRTYVAEQGRDMQRLRDALVHEGQRRKIAKADLSAQLAAAQRRADELAVENAELREAAWEVVRISDRRHTAWDRVKAILATAPATRGAVILAAADEMADDLGALLTHFQRHTTHRCEIDRDAGASLSRYRAALAAGAACICGGEAGAASGLPRTAIVCPKCDGERE